MPGPRAMSRPAFPNVPGAGKRNAAGLIHWSGVGPPGGISETPGTRSGRSLTVYPYGTAVAERLIITLTGSALRAVPMPLRDQPPNTDRARPRRARYARPAPNGRSYTAFALKK